MELLVETLTGTAFEMTVSPTDTIFAIKSKIFRVEGIPVSQQHLVHNLRELEDGASLRDLQIGAGARLRLVLGMRGGPVATRRLPPPAHHLEPWPDIERLLDSNRDEAEWSSGGCKVTVLVFRDGERVNMLRVRENRDGSYSPLDSANYCGAVRAGGGSGTSGTSVAEGATGAGGALRENAVTMGKMLELRRRMETLTLQRAACDATHDGDKLEMVKTRSEETLPTHLRDSPAPPYTAYPPYDADDGFGQNDYTRYSYECGFGSRYTLLPPIGAPADRAAPHRRQSRREGEERAILEECAAGEECARAPSPAPSHHHYPHCSLVGGGGAWRGHSASALQLRAGAPPAHLPAPFSCSTSELENLQRNSRLLPGLSRARPREHLHLSDEGLHLRRDPAPAPAPTPPPAPAPAPRADRLYLRRDSSQPPAVDDRLYLARDHTLSEDRLYMRREQLTSAAEDRLYMRTDPQLSTAEDRLYMRTDPQLLTADERLYMRTDPHLSNAEDRLYNRKESSQSSQIEDRLYMPSDATVQSSQVEDRVYTPIESSVQAAEGCLSPREPRGLRSEELFLREVPPGFEARSYMQGEPISLDSEDRLYMRRDISSQMSGGEGRLYLRREQVPEPEERQSRIQKIVERERAREAARGGEGPPPIEATVDGKEKKIRLRCGWCKKRLSVATVHVCRCGGAWCAQHRYKEVHGCAWDYKAGAGAAGGGGTAPLTHPKLPKI